MKSLITIAFSIVATSALAIPDQTDANATRILPREPQSTKYAQGLNIGLVASPDMWITAYVTAECGSGGQENWTYVKNGVNMPFSAGFRSYKLGRALLPFEQLDFSSPKNGAGVPGGESANGVPEGDIYWAGGYNEYPECGHYSYTADWKHSQEGCHDLGNSAQCANFWHH